MNDLSGFVKRLRDIMRNDAGLNGDAQRIEQIAWMLFLKVYDAKEQDWEATEDGYQSIIPEKCRWANWAANDRSGHDMTGDTLLNFVNNTLFPTLKRLDISDETPVRKAIVKTTFEDANQYMKDGVLLRQVLNIIDQLDLSSYEESHAFGEIYESILRELQSAGSAGEFYTPRGVTDFMAHMIRPKLGEQMADFACGTGGFITSWLKELPTPKNTNELRLYASSIYGIEKKQFPYMLCITNMLLHNIDVPNVIHDNALIRDILDYTEKDRFDVIMMNPPYGGSEKADIKSHFPNDLASSETADLFMALILYRLKKNGRAAVILPDGFLFGTDNAKLNIKKKLLAEFDLHTVIRLPGSVFSPYTNITTNILFFENTHPTQETWFYRLDMPEGYKHFSKTKPIRLEHFAPVIEWWENRRELAVDGFDKSKKFTVQQLSEELGYNFDQCCYPHQEEEILDPLDLIQRYQEERASLNAKTDWVLSDITALLKGDSTSHIERTGEQKSQVRNISEDLRKSILQQAIRGKLVEQRPKEGTAEELYKQIQSEKVKLLKAGKIKKEKLLPEITEDEIPFEIPETWKWTRLPDITYMVGNKANQILAKDVKTDGKYPAVSQGASLIDGYCDDKGKVISNLPLVMFGDHTRNVKYIDFQFVISADGTKFMKAIGFDSKYLFYWTTLISKNLRNRGYARHFTLLVKELFPLPPLEEQKRIVAKIEELLPLCEKLK